MSGDREDLAARLREEAAAATDEEERERLLDAALEAEGTSLLGSGERRYESDRDS